MLLLVIVLKNAKPINLIFYCSISLLSRIPWKRWVRTKVSKQCHNSCYFGCALHSRCSQLFSKPVALDRCCVSMGWFCKCSVGVITISAQALAIVTIASHCIQHCLLFSHPSWLSPNSLSLLSPLWTLLSMLKFALFPAVIMLIVVLGASTNASWRVICKTKGKDKCWRSAHHKRK